ncbi:M23 family metallopeptidase [Salmonirosea aquatica]|uniref:Peptidoglycan DD-metalloendopeptidase family protein n=1 Tax=Salmonirosea aquatica TaxID=2654236 RepID=A0A7C9F7J2_9BACT|nr:peptidoglycan DD-metalloendopeptidase family protein [Cytophagaceae bacterium SJW1-29]
MIWRNVGNSLMALSVIMALMGWSRVETPSEQMLNYVHQFQQIQIDIRECNVSPDSAARAFQATMRNIQSVLPLLDSCRDDAANRFVYPLRGYLPRYSIGGNGRGFRAKGFDLFDADARGSHPAHDLFIRDGNQDNLDDHMCLPVDLLSFSQGVVLATDTTWQPESELRGGNFVWVYDPCLNGLFYYAHNSRVVVQPGQWVQSGQKLGEIGRTGLNAYKGRSPTHVHMMFLRLDSSYLPQPENPLAWLREAEVKEW